MRPQTNSTPNKFPGTRVFIGETYLPNIAELEKQYGTPDNPEFQLPMDTQVGFINKLDVATFRAKLIDAEEHLDGHTPLLVFDNHDNPRLDARYGDGVHNTDIERVISTILFASRGASLFYYGDEIGMKTTPPTRKEDVKDPVGLTGWPKEKGRDGERTPMQWDARAECGLHFSLGQALAARSSRLHHRQRQGRRGEPRIALRLVSDPDPPEENKPGLGLRRRDHARYPRIRTCSAGCVKARTISPSLYRSTSRRNRRPSACRFPAPGATLETLLKTPGAADPSSLQSIQLGPLWRLRGGIAAAEGSSVRALSYIRCGVSAIWRKRPVLDRL